MNKPVRVPAAIFSPGHCMICGGHEGEMIDTQVDFGEYRYYICVRMCAPLIAEALGDATPAALIADLCEATKKNGQRCTAYALPGKRLCVAHTRVRDRALQALEV